MNLKLPKLGEQLNSTQETPISVSMVQRGLRNYGLKGCIASKKNHYYATKTKLKD